MCVWLGRIQYIQHSQTSPVVVLRGFDEVPLNPGERKVVALPLTRRDLSNWNTDSQNWEITSDAKTVFVGASSRDLQLNASLPL